MRGAPRAASVSASDAATAASRLAPALIAAPTRLAYPRSRRLRRPAEFAAVAAAEPAGGSARWRAARRLVAVQALIVPAPVADAPCAVRFGVTVGKRNARRAVDRARVKRVLREAARHAAPALDEAAGGRRVAAVLRLKAALPAPQDHATLQRAQLGRQLRREADELLAQLAQHLAQGAA